MSKTVAYLRVSTDKQDVQAQRLEILDRLNAENAGRVDEWVEVEISSRRSVEDRGITNLMANLERGDLLVVAELSRLGRSSAQVIRIVTDLVKKRVRLWTIKENIRLGGEDMDVQAKIMVWLFALLAEIERDLISQRTKAGLAAARAKGKILGAPKGRRWSKLDKDLEEIQGYMAKGVSQASMAKIFGVSPSTMHDFIRRRGLLG